MPASNIASLFEALTKSANLVVNTIRSKTSSGYPQGDDYRGYTSIGDATSIGMPTKDGDAVYIDVLIDLRKAPYAIAYEFGSGVHGSRGSTYPIEPKNKPELAFEWEPSNPVGAMSSRKFNRRVGEVWFFNKVDHPGVEAKPFLQPSVEENAQQIKDMIGEGANRLLAEIVGNMGFTVEVKL